jgi:8-oxo-dGTP pyrophosphatase MutT (NUDIX family)
MPEFDAKATRIQAELDAFLLLGEGAAYEFDDPDFLFRHASGGALPVIRMADKDYYCLFYRDIHPVGWNIANGGCDSRKELADPLEAAERELREELLVIDSKNKRRYVFAGDAGKPVDWPEFSVARRLWTERLNIDLGRFQERQIPLMWLPGPDKLYTRVGNTEANMVTDCFININALDFGIEIDRIAKLGVDQDAVLCDGEMTRGLLENAPIGLFEVFRLNRQLALGTTEFVPDHVFYDACRYDGHELEHIVYDRFLPRLAPIRSTAGVREFESSEKKFDLCPVTRRIIARYLSLRVAEPVPHGSDCQVIISFTAPDVAYARRVYEFLSQKKNVSVFFSEESIHDADFLPVIEDAHDQTRSFIAVATDPNFLLRQWPEYEYRRFHVDILNSRKPDGRTVSYISGFAPEDLLGPLRYRQAALFDKFNSDPLLE